MKVFLSHSWENKTPVQKVANALREASYDVWLDAGDLLPGQNIQAAIDAVIAEMDVILLFWSKDSAISKGVAAEIATALALHKLLIPCKLDYTAMTDFPQIRGLKGISFTDLDDGIGRLKMALLNYQAAGFNMQNNEGMLAMNRFMGSLETAHHLIDKKDIKNTGTAEDKDFWAGHIEKTHDESFLKMQEMQRIGLETQTFLQQKMEELQVHLNDREACERILKEMENYPYASEGAMPTFIEKVRRICESFQTDEKDSVIESYRAVLRQKSEETFQTLKSATGWLVGSLFDSSFEDIRYFFEISADHLQMLVSQSKSPHAPTPVKTACTDLLAYLQTPGGIIDNNQFGMLGYTDDAFLINAVTLSLVQKGLIEPSNPGTDWEKTDRGATFVLNFIDDDTKSRLQAECQRYIETLLNGEPDISGGTVESGIDELQQARQDLWEARITGLRGDLNYGTGPIY